MIVKNLSISEIRMTEFDPKTKGFTLDIYTSEGSMQKAYKLVLINALPDQILNDIKKEKLPSDDEDDDVENPNSSFFMDMEDSVTDQEES